MGSKRQNDPYEDSEFYVEAFFLWQTIKGPVYFMAFLVAAIAAYLFFTRSEEVDYVAVEDTVCSDAARLLGATDYDMSDALLLSRGHMSIVGSSVEDELIWGETDGEYAVRCRFNSRRVIRFSVEGVNMTQQLRMMEREETSARPGRQN